MSHTFPNFKNRSRKRRLPFRSSGLLSLLALMAIVLAIIATTQLLHQEASDSRVAQLALADIRHQLDNQHAEEAQAMGYPEDAQAIIQRSNALNTELFKSINELSDRHVPIGTVQRVRRATGAYQQALSSSYAMLQSGNFEQARHVDKTVARPAYENLDVTLSSETTILGRIAEKSERTARIGTLSTMILGVFMCASIMWQQNRRRRTADAQKMQQKTEERLRSLLHNSSDVIVVTDEAGVIRHVTPPRRSFLIAESGDGEGLPLQAYLHAESANELEAALHSTGEERFAKAFEWRAARSDGTWSDIECLTSDLTGDPNVDGLVFTLRDVTARRQLEVELRQSQKLEAVGRLSGGVAHEINTPLQYIDSNLRFLSESFESLLEVAREHLSEASDASATSANDIDRDLDIEFLQSEIPEALDAATSGVNRVAAIIRSLKMFGESGPNEINPSDINEMIANTLILAESETRDVAEVVTEFGELPTVPVFVGEMNQVWLNLLTNAAHAVADAKRDRGLITVRTFLSDENVVIEFEDNGVGISKEATDHIFEPFYTTKDVGRGMGQGLVTARQTVVSRHHGTLTFESEPGVGTTFRVTLPIALS